MSRIYFNITNYAKRSKKIIADYELDASGLPKESSKDNSNNVGTQRVE